MTKRLIAIVVTASLASAILLYIGTTVIGKFSPAFASSLPALVAGNGRGGLDDTPSAPASTPQAVQTDNRRGADKPEDDATVQSTPVDNRRGADKPEDNSTPQAGGVNSGTPITGVTIAQLLASPANYLDRVFDLSGIATSLSGDKFLINDGTGQIIVDLEDDLVSLVIATGSTITVTGEFRESGGQRGFEIDACVITDQNGSVVVDACEFGRHGGDDGTDDRGGQSGSSSDDNSSGSTNNNGVDDNSNSGSGSSNSGFGLAHRR